MIIVLMANLSKGQLEIVFDQMSNNGTCRQKKETINKFKLHKYKPKDTISELMMISNPIG